MKYQSEKTIMNKWSNVLEKFFTDKDLLKLMCRYAEEHYLNENEMTRNLPPIDSTTSISIKALSKINNLNKVNIVFESDDIKLQRHIFRLSINNESYNELHLSYGLDTKKIAEDLTINEAARYLNESIETELKKGGITTLYIRCFIESMESIMEKGNTFIEIKIAFGIKTYEI